MIRTLRERYPTHAILGFGANSDPTSISRALFVGADGFVDKNIDPVDFLQALRRAADREMVLAIPLLGRGEIVEGHRAPARAHAVTAEASPIPLLVAWVVVVVWLEILVRGHGALVGANGGRT